MLTIEKEATKYTPRWLLKDEYGREIWRVTKEGYHVPVTGKTKAEVMAWVLRRFETYMKCANNGVLPGTVYDD
jgi:hypothetical protein